MPEFIVRDMAQCDSKVFFPDDPSQVPQFNDCPRQSETTRHTIHAIVRLCAKCAEVWDEQERQIVAEGAHVSEPASWESKVSLEVSGVTRVSEEGHRALHRSGRIKEGNGLRSGRCAVSGSRQQENARC